MGYVCALGECAHARGWGRALKRGDRRVRGERSSANFICFNGDLLSSPDQRDNVLNYGRAEILTGTSGLVIQFCSVRSTKRTDVLLSES